ncbi:MAG TPA: diguanylate cyclase [Actinomycetota bacterium]
MAVEAGAGATVLVADEDGERSERAVDALRADTAVSYRLLTAADKDQTRDHLAHDVVDVALVAFEPGGSELLTLLRQRAPDVPIVAIVGDPGAAREVLDAGVQDFVAERDLGGEVLRRTVRYALDQRRLREELDRRTFIDELTGLYNANGFEQIAVHHLRLADRTEEPLVLVFVRIDDLAAVGQTYGAAEGPRLLADTARILRASVRESDIVARVGPDAFCALLTGNATGAETLILARMVEAVATHNARGGRPYPLALSVGAARYDPMHPMGLSELIREADAQMRRRSTPIR